MWQSDQPTLARGTDQAPAKCKLSNDWWKRPHNLITSFQRAKMIDKTGHYIQGQRALKNKDGKYYAPYAAT